MDTCCYNHVQLAPYVAPYGMESVVIHSIVHAVHGDVSNHLQIEHSVSTTSSDMSVRQVHLVAWY